MTSKAPLLPCVQIDPPVPVRSSVLWLHGLGADGHDFEPIVPMLGLAPDLGIRFVFPHAPRIPVTINMGMVMPAWYDVVDLALRTRQDVDGIRGSAAHLEALITQEVERGVPPSRIVLAGFSQGGAIALHVALRHEEPLAGLMALSTYLVLPDLLEAERSEASRGLSVFQAHGTLDPMVPIAAGREARDRLRALGLDVAWHEYRMAHEVCLEEVRDVGAWLSRLLA